jgi:transcriptional regulator with XRE-family HTH domain
LLPEQVRAWREREGLTQEQAAEQIGDHLGRKTDVRTIQRWEAGENLPHPITYLKMQPLLNGKTNYLQMQQTLDNGTQSYGAFVKRDEATPADIARLLYEPIERSYKKGLISEEDWKAHQERRAADYQAAAQRQPARKRGRPRKKHRSR